MQFTFYNWLWVCSNEGVRPEILRKKSWIHFIIGRGYVQTRVLRSEIFRKKSWIIKSFSILLGAIFSYTFFEIDRYGGFSMFFCLCFLDNIF